MDYQISEKIKDTFARTIALPPVAQAIEEIRADHPFSMEEHKAFILCEAPTFHEEERAKLFAQKLTEYGLADVRIDGDGNVWGIRKGIGNGPVILVEAHMDTVFPFGSVKEVRDESGVVYAPGATDNTRGMTALLAVLRAMNKAQIRTKGDIIFCGTSREEGMGSLGGMRDFLEHGPKVDASISVDGADTEAITCEATGYRTDEVNFYGIGGHAYSAFGEMANPLHAAARAVAKIADFRVSADPKTTFCVSNFHAGNDAGVHAIVPKATIKFNIRSNSQALLDELEARVYKAVQEACDEETYRWGKDTITWDSRRFCEVPAGKQDRHAPLVEAAVAAALHFTPEARRQNVAIRDGGCVNGNMAIGRGVPCVTIGGGGLNRCIHSTDEYFPYEGAYALPQEVLTLLCMAAGVDGAAEPLF